MTETISYQKTERLAELPGGVADQDEAMSAAPDALLALITAYWRMYRHSPPCGSAVEKDFDALLNALAAYLNRIAR
jgi:hypothetical protein